MSRSPGWAVLEQVLTEARELGFVAGESVGAHIEHALRFADAAPAPARAFDLGSGGGLPGLPLALHWPESQWLLIESNRRRAAFLEGAVLTLAVEDRVGVRLDRAEVVGRDPAWRGQGDLVVARAFGPPAAVAECGAPLLAVGGRLVVSEPPSSRAWPAEGLALLNLRPLDASQHNLQVLEQVASCPDRFPRRVGVPSRRPLFDVPRGTRGA